MVDPRMTSLLKKAADLTENDRISWKEAEKEDAFLASFTAYSLKIASRASRMDPNSTEYFLSILDEWGEVIEEVGDEEFDDGGATFMAMKGMFDKARRGSRGVDKALDSLLDDLDDLDVPK